MDTETPWLSERRQRIWRNWLRMNTELPAALHRRLRADSDLSLSDYDVLVQLTDAAEARVRVLDLARALRWERSRLSHHIKRMENRGLVRREEVPGDGRGAFVVLTPAGRRTIEQAAPGHARIVRSLVFDSLTDEEWGSLMVAHGHFGPMPIFMFAIFQLVDYGVHGWDMRQGTGERHAMDGATADLLAPLAIGLVPSMVHTDENLKIGLQITSGPNAGTP